MRKYKYTLKTLELSSLSYSRYYENKHSLLKASHLLPEVPQTPLVLQHNCPVCLVGAEECNLTKCSLGCDHLFCSNCWTEYLTAKVTAGVATGQSILSSTPKLLINEWETYLCMAIWWQQSNIYSNLMKVTYLWVDRVIYLDTEYCNLMWVFVPAGIECMQCPVRLGLEKVQQLLHLQGGDWISRFNGFALSEFVQSHQLLRWCPGADCSIVFQVKEPLAKKVTCSKCHSTCWYVHTRQFRVQNC